MCQESLGFLRPFFLAVALSCMLSGAQGQALTDSQLQQIKQACEILVLDYANHRDQSLGERLAQLFTEDAELLVNGQTFVGREALRNRFKAPATQTFRHMMSNVQITVTGETQATGVSYALIFAGAIEPQNPGAPIVVSDFLAMGEYHDTFELTDVGWRIASRRFVPVFLSNAQ